jgi:hypothetical protein
MTTNKYEAWCHHDKDGEIKYWQGVLKEWGMCHTSPLMHKEDIQHISSAFESCLGGYRSQFHKVNVLAF